MNDGPHVSLKGTTNHPREGEGGAGIAEGSLDDVEKNMHDKGEDVIEETNTVFEGDDDNAVSEGSVSVENHVYPNQGNLLAHKDDQITQKIKYLI